MCFTLHFLLRLLPHTLTLPFLLFSERYKRKRTPRVNSSSRPRIFITAHGHEFAGKNRATVAATISIDPPMSTPDTTTPVRELVARLRATAPPKRAAAERQLTMTTAMSGDNYFFPLSSSSNLAFTSALKALSSPRM